MKWFIDAVKKKSKQCFKQKAGRNSLTSKNTLMVEFIWRETHMTLSQAEGFKWTSVLPVCEKLLKQSRLKTLNPNWITALHSQYGQQCEKQKFSIFLKGSYVRSFLMLISFERLFLGSGIELEQLYYSIYKTHPKKLNCCPVISIDSCVLYDTMSHMDVDGQRWLADEAS